MSPYAEFSSRLAALFCDFVVAIFVATAFIDHMLVPGGVDVENRGFVVFGVLFLYVTAAWASPLRATPFQFLFGLRVVDQDGHGLAPGMAAIRAIAMTLIFAGTFLLLRPPPQMVTTALGIAAFVLGSMAIVSRKRQGAHDVLARSVVVRRRALIDSVPLENQPLSWYRAGSDIVVIALLMFLFWNVAAMQHDREMIARTNYAYYETAGLRTAVAFFHEEEQRWPDNEMELGAATRGEYPDGGYYEMQPDGVVRIRFEVLPELTGGSLVLTPVVDESGYSWTCHVDGHIKRRYVPTLCREDPE